MRRLWLGFAAVVAISFSILGWIGTRIYQQMPPLPDRVVTNEGEEVVAAGAIGGRISSTSATDRLFRSELSW